MNKNQHDLRLFPIPFKKIAYGLLILSILFITLSRLELIAIFEKNVVINIFKIGLLTSLLILALTRNKIEDELTIRIRLKAFTMSFIFGVGYVIVKPFVNLLTHDGFIFELESSDILILMLIVNDFYSNYMLKSR